MIVFEHYVFPFFLAPKFLASLSEVSPFAEKKSFTYLCFQIFIIITIIFIHSF